MSRSATRNKVGRDAAYLAWIRTLPCVVCQTWERVCQGVGLHWQASNGRTEAAHVGTRGLSQKAPDSTAIPLCKMHHTEGKDAAHKLGKRFWDHHGLDRDALIFALQAQYRERAA